MGPEQGRVGGGRPRSLWPTDECALGTQETSLVEDEQRRHDRWHVVALDNGVLGGKVVGAGGGGFLMPYANDRIRLRAAMRETGLQEVRFRFDFEGTEVIAQS
jgi:hypothetical protein